MALPKEKSTKEKSTKEKMVVAIDGFQKAKDAAKLVKASKTIGAIMRQGSYTAHAATVVSPDQLSWPSNFAPALEQFFERMGKSALDTTVERLGIEFEGPGEVLVQPFHSRKLSAQALTKFTAQNKASLLAIATHVRDPKRRAAFGGFADTLMNVSNVPVLAVNAAAEPLKRFSSILFACDFSQASRDAYQKVLELAARLNCRVRLFHRLLNPFDSMVIPSSPFVPAAAELSDFFSSHEDEMYKLAADWAKGGKKYGVKVEIVFDKKLGTTAERILEWSHGDRHHRADIIAVAPQAGPYAGLVLGSVSRDLLRMSKKPVLLVH